MSFAATSDLCLAEIRKVLWGCDWSRLRGHNIMIRHDHLRKNLPSNFIRRFTSEARRV
jgi:hypothetical protein